jgi:FKBP-type peptidyl-prolyl cis-trans isomerase SlyD
MQINNTTVASIHYTLKDEAGEILDTSEGQAPLEYVHGTQHIVPGLENALEGKSANDKLTIVVPAEEGYGEHHAMLVQEVPREIFSGIDTIEIGMEFQAQTPNGVQVVEVTHIDGDTITVDGNHPLAGKSLHFDVEVVDVREASSEELESGQVSG